jgi:acetyl esterase/lipase
VEAVAQFDNKFQNRPGISMPKRIVLILISFFLSSTGFSQALSPLHKWATIEGHKFPFYQNIEYQEANTVKLHLDVITAGPTSEARPTLTHFHGGGWIEGEKGGPAPWMLPYLTRGMNVVDVEYRLGPQSLAPAAVEDCRCALHWVFDHAGKFGFDKTKIVTMGESAGGHLALMTGMLRPRDGFDYECRRLENDWRKRTIDDVKVAAIIDFFGPIDLPALLRGPNTRNYAVRWFGGQPNRMELAERLTPLRYVREGLPPIIIIDGSKDFIVPYEQSVSLHEALDQAGDPNELVTIQGGGHGSTPPFAWTDADNLRAQAAVFRFLEERGVLSR